MKSKLVCMGALMAVALAACALEQESVLTSDSEALRGRVEVGYWADRPERLWPERATSAALIVTPAGRDDSFLAFGVLPDEGVLLWAYEVPREAYAELMRVNADEWVELSAFDGFQSETIGSIGGVSPPPVPDGSGELVPTAVANELVAIGKDTLQRYDMLYELR